MKFKNNEIGLAQIPLMIVLLFMAVAIPVATKLVQQNQDSRNLATVGICNMSTGPVPNQIKVGDTFNLDYYSSGGGHVCTDILVPEGTERVGTSQLIREEGGRFHWWQGIRVTKAGEFTASFRGNNVDTGSGDCPARAVGDWCSADIRYTVLVPIKGRVIDSDSGKGVSGVEINKDYSSGCDSLAGVYKTDADGYFTAAIEYGKGYCLRGPLVNGIAPVTGVECQIAGYKSDPDSCGHTTASGGNIDKENDNEFEIKYHLSVATPTPTLVPIRGRVIDIDTGSGVAGVDVNKDYSSGCGSLTGVYKTDADGYFTATIDYGKGYCLRGPLVNGIAPVFQAECQIAGYLSDPDACGHSTASGGNIDKEKDTEFEIKYHLSVTPPTVSLCTQCPDRPTRKNLGDADCDGTTTINDASIWRAEYFTGNQGVTNRNSWNADFDCNGKVDTADFSKWMSEFTNSLGN